MADCQISRKEERIINAVQEMPELMIHAIPRCGVEFGFGASGKNKRRAQPVCPFCEQHTRGVRRAYFNSASTTTGSGELFMANSDSNLLFGN